MNKKAFTLIELIITIAILMILVTIGLLALKSHVVDSKNAVKISDITHLSNGLEIYKQKENKLPLPDNYSIIQDFNGLDCWSQGVFGKMVFKHLDGLLRETKDPITDEYYYYSLLNNGNNFQLLTFIDGRNLESKNPMMAKIIGNYDGYFLTDDGINYNLYKLNNILANPEQLTGFEINIGEENIIQSDMNIEESKTQVLMQNIKFYVDGTKLNFVAEQVKNGFGLDSVEIADIIIQNVLENYNIY